MGKGIYTYYKERLIEIGGNNKCLYLKNIARKSAYDLGRLFEGRNDKISDFVDFLWSGGKFPLTIISDKEKASILRNLDVADASAKASKDGSEVELDESAKKKQERVRREASKRAIDNEITRIKELKREVEELEKETGRYELYVGYPFVFGCIHQGSTKTAIKAPLLLFPVTVDISEDNTVEIRRNDTQKVQINQALVFAYAQSRKLSLEGAEFEFDDFSQFKSVKDVVDYLAELHIKIDCQPERNVYPYSKFKEPECRGTELSVRRGAVIGRFPLSNSIYNDYTKLEKKKLTNDAINELLTPAKVKPKKKVKKKKRGKKAPSEQSYAVKMLDFAQSEVVKKVDKNGNMVIYGPPGTGKSQTIVNIITDALCKNKRVLVVSQKKAALDVVYNRLGTLSAKAMYVVDESKEKQSFYERCLNAHQACMVNSLADIDALRAEFDSTQRKIDDEVLCLEKINTLLNTVRPFGLSLGEMYSSSYMLPKNSPEYALYLKMLENKTLMDLDYAALKDVLFGIRSMELAKIYYNFLVDKEKNPLIDSMQADIDIRTLSEVKARIEELQKAKKGLFSTSKYPYYRQVLAYFDRMEDDGTLDTLVKTEMKLSGMRRLFASKDKDDLKNKYTETYAAIKEYASDYECLLRVMTKDGYAAVVDNVLRGNFSYLKLVLDAINGYISVRDTARLISGLDKSKLAVLSFAYTESKNYQNYNEIIDKIMLIRIYHEVLRYEEECKNDFSCMVDFANITSKIMKLKESQLDISLKLAEGQNSRKYDEVYAAAKNNKDYLYQISKTQKFWPIRKTMEVYCEFILSLFPCWLLSPENVSNLLPLEKNLFDLVIFDEASQVFIENTIPTIYRGKNIVVAGDAKQLRPSATFVKRFLGADFEDFDDYSVQAALEVESLLDLAVSRYESANLTYHYRSRSQELIDFSNHAFYGNDLRVVPNTTRNLKETPIVRYKVNGKWENRRNEKEAKKVVELLREIFTTRKNNESIGIITFNIDQQSCIADMIEKEASKDPLLREFITKETHRFENGEDTGLFIKNLENVQGDERDIIIFSIGYAENAQGRVHTSFGSLSAAGGENRLNVAVTRARSKIIVVTSIEPEELKVDGSKNQGPKLLRKYLTYVRAVSNKSREEADAILKELDAPDARTAERITSVMAVEEQMKERLEKLGYKVDIGLGNKNNRISLAVYDEKKDKYLVGVELDYDAFLSSESCLERDVYKPKFLESRGWTVIRVWCRDWWLYPSRVLKTITAAAEKNKK